MDQDRRTRSLKSDTERGSAFVHFDSASDPQGKESCMRIIRIFAVLLAVAGVSAIGPASAETSLTRSTTIAAPIAAPSGTTATADQYRDRGRHNGWRNGNRGWRGGDRGWRGRGYGYRGGYGYRDRGYYAPRYAYGRPYRWRGSRLACRTSWRWGRPHRVCFRRW
jgi:hypothetical protein